MIVDVNKLPLKSVGIFLLTSTGVGLDPNTAHSYVPRYQATVLWSQKVLLPGVQQGFPVLSYISRIFRGCVAHGLLTKWAYDLLQVLICCAVVVEKRPGAVISACNKFTALTTVTLVSVKLIGNRHRLLQFRSFCHSSFSIPALNMFLRISFLGFLRPLPSFLSPYYYFAIRCGRRQKFLLESCESSPLVPV